MTKTQIEFSHDEIADLLREAANQNQDVPDDAAIVPTIDGDGRIEITLSWSEES